MAPVPTYLIIIYMPPTSTDARTTFFLCAYSMVFVFVPKQMMVLHKNAVLINSNRHTTMHGMDWLGLERNECFAQIDVYPCNNKNNNSNNNHNEQIETFNVTNGKIEKLSKERFFGTNV